VPMGVARMSELVKTMIDGMSLNLLHRIIWKMGGCLDGLITPPSTFHLLNYIILGRWTRIRREPRDSFAQREKHCFG
jgi:hypothetical protein